MASDIAGPQATRIALPAIGYPYGNGKEPVNGTDASTITNCWITTFDANSTGLGAKRWDLDASGAVDGDPTTYGLDINTFTYSGAASELAVFLAEDIAAFTDADVWFQTNGPLTYEAAAISD